MPTVGFEPLFLVVYAFFLLERAFELVLDQDHRARLRKRGARFYADDAFGLLVLAQAILFIGLLVETSAAAWAEEHPGTVPLLGVAFLAQLLRYWAVRSLGVRWSLRIVTLPGQPLVRRGPYRFLRHPNYFAVLLEAIALPLAFGALVTAALVVPLQAVALVRRIRREDAALAVSQ